MNGWSEIWRDTNNTLLAPFVALPSLGLAATNATVGATARLAEQAVRATGDTFGTTGKLARRVSERIADQTFDRARTSIDNAADAIRNASGRPTDRNSNQLLSATVLDQMTATAALPLTTGWEAALAARDVPAVKDGVYDFWIALSRFLDTRSSHGVLTGRQRSDTDSLIRFGFFYMTTQGPLQAVARDFRGIVGGVLALGMGDFKWLADAAKDYWVSMEYVYDKWLADETQPESDFPIGPVLAEDSKEIIKRFPRPFIEALESEDPERVLKALFDDSGEILTLLTLYPSTAFRVVYDVAKFVVKAWLEVSDSLDYALCELAIVETGTVTGEHKEIAMERLRKTAGNATIEFEYYVPLLVPFGGTPADQAHRTNVCGEKIDHYTIAQSVFRPSAIERAQAITSEVIQLRAFLWLYRDEEVAREKSFQETARKFGPEAAERIRDNPLYPLTDEEISDLTAGASEGRGEPRSAGEIKEIFYNVLRRRGLLYVSDRVSGTRLSADYSVEYSRFEEQEQAGDS